MRWTTAVTAGALLFVAGLLIGFFPQHQRASKLADELKDAQLQSTLTEIRELALLSYLDASKMNYGSAAEDSERMFGLAREIVNQTKDENLRNSLNGLLTFQETVRAKLSAADASALEPLQQIVQKTQNELKR